MFDLSPTASGVGLLMAGATIGLASIDRSSDGSNLGVLLCLAGIVVLAVNKVCRAIRETNRPADVAYQDGYESGYDKGWRDGRAASVPKLVVLPTPGEARSASN